MHIVLRLRLTVNKKGLLNIGIRTALNGNYNPYRAMIHHSKQNISRTYQIVSKRILQKTNLQF